MCGEELKWHQLAHNQLMSQQGPHSVVHTVQLKPMIKSHSAGRMDSSGIRDVMITSLYTEKAHLKKLMMMKMIIKRASGASKAFSLVMNSNNCLRIRVLTRNACLHLVNMSSTGICN